MCGPSERSGGVTTLTSNCIFRGFCSDPSLESFGGRAATTRTPQSRPLLGCERLGTVH
jgi:hypothetical protein